MSLVEEVQHLLLVEDLVALVAEFQIMIILNSQELVTI